MELDPVTLLAAVSGVPIPRQLHPAGADRSEKEAGLVATGRAEGIVQGLPPAAGAAGGNWCRRWQTAVLFGVKVRVVHGAF